MTDNTAPTRLDEGVTFTLDLSTVIDHAAKYDSDGEYAGGEPVTLGDRVAEIVAFRLAQQAERDAKQWIGSVRDKATEIADRVVEEKFRDLIDREIVPTDTYGAPKGEPTTLAEIIVKRADAWLTTKVGDGYNRASKTNLEKLIDDAVGRAFQAEVSKAVKAAQAAAVAEVSKQAADVFAEIIRRAAS